MDTKELLYYNGFGGFSKDGKEYIIKTDEEYTPAPWSHLIANPNFGTLVTSDGGGYTWSHNSRENKLTTWENDPVGDKASEKITLEVNQKKIPILPYETLEGFEIHYGFGYAKFLKQIENMNIETFIYVPINESKKVVRITIENNSDSTLNCAVSYFADVVLGVAKEYTSKHLIFEKVPQGVNVTNTYRECYAEEKIALYTMINDSSYTVDTTIDEFRNVTVKNSFEMLPHQKVDVFFELKVVTLENVAISQSNANVLIELETIRDYWEKKMRKIQIKTPVESMNIMMNGWLSYQTIVSRLWGRTSFYQAGGAFGFRDQLQDSLLMLYLDPAFARNQILYHAAHEFKEGDVLHWWHPEKSNGIRTRYTDDLLWLPYLISEYIEKEGDFTILDEKIPYVEMEELREEEGERYSEVTISKEKESLYLHAIRAIEKSLHFGENGLAEMGTRRLE